MAKVEYFSYTPAVGDIDDFGDRMNAQFDVLDVEAKEALDRYEATGSILGAIYNSPYADSYAVYKVTKLRPFTVTHVDVGDAWRLPAAHLRGLNAADIKGYLESQLRWRDIAAKPR